MRDPHLAELADELTRKRAWTDKSHYVQGVANYVVAYCAKGEVSATACSDIFKAIVTDRRLRGETSFRSIAARLISKLITTREISDSEAAFLLSQLPLTRWVLETANASGRLIASRV